MSMMVTPPGGGQIIAAGEPFKLRLKKKKPAEPAPDAAGTDEPDATTDTDGTRRPAGTEDDGSANAG